VTACIDGHAEIVQALIKAGADVNERGLSPLIHAANGGFAEITRLLLAAGADVSAEVEGVGTALDYAWTQRPVRGETGRWDEVIQLLEAAGTPMRTKVKKKTKRR
jgi:ankyrin repeat protein